MRDATFTLMLAASLPCLLSVEDAPKLENRDSWPPGKLTAALKKVEKVELYSLDPRTEVAGFQGWGILGSCTVTDAERDQLLAALVAGNAKHDGRASKCFEPRHGLRCKTDQGEIDVVICFACMHIHIVSPDAKTSHFTTTSDPQAVFDKFLRSHWIRLAPK